jgi:hypothetical protein
MKNVFLIALCLFSVAGSTIGNGNNFNSKKNTVSEYTSGNNNMEAVIIKIKIGSKTFNAKLANNKSAEAFSLMLPLIIQMTELNGNEKYFDLPQNLPSNSSNPKSINKGDLMLYGSRTIVLFYKGFSTSYSYTRLGKVDDPTGLASALGAGNVKVSFEKE